MQENVYERIHHVLTWKRIIAFNVFLFLVLVVPLSVRLAQEDTENRSSAAENEPLPSVIPPAAYPEGAPVIERVTEFFGKKGDTIVVFGSNFGDYQWDSQVFVGNVQAPNASVVRWSNAVIEVQIPETARTGQVWVVVDGRQATWEGSLLLTDVARSAQVGLTKATPTEARLWLSNAVGVVRGMVELSHVGIPVDAQIIGNGAIITESDSTDSLGRKTRVEFTLDQPLTSSSSDILTISHTGIGALEILRVELYDVSDRLVSAYTDPLTEKVQ